MNSATPELAEHIDVGAPEVLKSIYRQVLERLLLPT